MEASVLFSARFVLGCIFLASARGKFLSSRSFADEIFDYQLLTRKQAQIAAHTLPFAELAVGLLCVVGFALAPASILATLLLLVFTGAITINLLRGRHFSCHCFGSSSAMIGPAAIVRNLALIVIALWILFHAPMALNFSSLILLWKGDVQQFAHIDILAPLVATIFLSLTILFLLGEVDTLLDEKRTMAT